MRLRARAEKESRAAEIFIIFRRQNGKIKHYSLYNSRNIVYNSLEMFYVFRRKKANTVKAE